MCLRRRLLLNLAPLFAGRGRILRVAKNPGEGPGNAVIALKDGQDRKAAVGDGVAARLSVRLPLTPTLSP